MANFCISGCLRFSFSHFFFLLVGVCFLFVYLACESPTRLCCYLLQDASCDAGQARLYGTYQRAGLDWPAGKVFELLLLLSLPEPSSTAMEAYSGVGFSEKLILY